ncbi:MAG: hypothetical protein HKN44_08425 [Ilumatobacter sp.]|nr:hypothetical protein [Ilumatobacter sp.]
MKNEAPAQQLTLLPTSTVSARFQLSRATRERGLRHVAEIRQLLAERQAAQAAEPADIVPIGHPGTRAA